MKIRYVLILLFCLIALLLPQQAVAQTTIDGDIASPYGVVSNARQSVYAADLYWIFYRDANEDIVYQTSPDKTTWSGITTLRTGNCMFPSIYYDDTYIHISFTEWVAGDTNLCYRMGTPQGNATINWVAPFDIDFVINTSEYLYPIIMVDSDGYPWRGYTIGSSTPDEIHIQHSSTKDGTFTDTGAGTLELEPGDYASSLPIACANGKVVAFWVDDDTEYPTAKLWTGVAWASDDVLSSIRSVWFYGLSAVAQDDLIHIVIIEDTTRDLEYITYDASTGAWGDATTIHSGGTDSDWGNPVISLDSLNNLYIYRNHITNEDIHYWKYNNYTSTWSSATLLVDETINGLQWWQQITAEYSPDSDKIVVYYLANSGSPYWLRITDLTQTASVITLSPTAVTSTSATLRGDVTDTGTGAITTRGVQYNTSPSATGAGYSQESGSFGTGVYSFPVTDFEADELYYVRAYATNGEGTAYGEWVAWLTAVQGGDPEQPDEPDEGMAPPVDTEGPVNWVTDPTTRTFSNWPFSDVINAFADMVSRSFAWFCFMVFAVSLVGIALCKYTRHLGITFLALGMLLGLYISGDAIDWWLIFPYLLVGISLIIKEQQYGWG